MPYYDPRVVPAHGNPESTVFLVNEAPGPCEAHYRIPSIGAQGGNIYHAFKKTKISWIPNYGKFSWPRLILESYKNPNNRKEAFQLRDTFLNIRARHITCTNAYHLWPRSSKNTCDWVDPDRTDVLSQKNIIRLKNEIPVNHKIILICGEFAWLACHGTGLQNPITREGTSLNATELSNVNSRLSANFVAGWYMGHTRRWSLNSNGSTYTSLIDVSRKAGW